MANFPPEGKLAVTKLTMRVESVPPFRGNVFSALHLDDVMAWDMNAEEIQVTVEDGTYVLNYSPPSTRPYFSVTPRLHTSDSVGEIFNVSVMVNNLDPAWEAVGFEFKLTYNSTLLQVLNVWEGPWLPPFGSSPNQGTDFLDESDLGQVHICDVVLPDSNGTWHGPFPLATDPNVEALVTIEFNSTLQGMFPLTYSCALILYDTKIADWVFESVYQTSPIWGFYSMMPRAIGSVYIRADGSIDPTTAPISTADFVTYTLTDNLNGSIVVEKDNIVIDGNGSVIQGSGSGTGIDLSGRTGVIVYNTQTTAFEYGFYLSSSSGNCIFGNTVANNAEGIWLNSSSDSNTICGNTVMNCSYGVSLYNSSTNTICRNNFVNNSHEVYTDTLSTNAWDGGYPSGGNYWSDYNGTDCYSGPRQNETGSDCIGDLAYIVDGTEVDWYPLMGPWTETGENLRVAHASGVTLTFDNVTSSGMTLVSETEAGPNPPLGFQVTSAVPIYYMISTTAGYSGSITLSMPYNDSGLTLLEEQNLRLMHWNSTAQLWEDITTHVNIEDNVVYGETEGFSEFAVFARLLGDINSDGTVNILDSIIVGKAFLATPSSSNWNPDADINNDNTVNILDSIIVGNHFLQHYP